MDHALRKHRAKTNKNERRLAKKSRQRAEKSLAMQRDYAARNSGDERRDGKIFVPPEAERSDPSSEPRMYCDQAVYCEHPAVLARRRK